MIYRFATVDEDYSDYAAGSVLHNRAGATSFPVRLADELFLRGKAYLAAHAKPPYRVYDPCCGTGYLLSVLGLRHGVDIAALFGSDIDADRVDVARSNLALLDKAGMQARISQLESYIAAYGKDSHRQALDSAGRLMANLPDNRIETRAFVANALEPVTEVNQIDMVITDVPYGQRVSWQGSDEETLPVHALLESLRPALKTRAFVAVVTDKSVKVRHDAYQRIERFLAGKRQITLLTLPG